MLHKGTFQIPPDTHVRSSIDMITEAAQLAGSGYAAVLGCGRCAEIPIRFLCKTFNLIDFVDIDAYAGKAVEAQCRLLGASDSCAFYQADLTGLISPFESNAREIAARSSEPLTCLDKLGQLLASTAPRFWTPAKYKRYSLIVCSAVLTQLQATVRRRVEEIFLFRFPEHRTALSLHEAWRKCIWNFARRLEDAFIDHIESLSAPGAIIYLSDTVHVCWLLESGPETLTTEGAWIATRTSRLADYLHPHDEIITERKWNWVRRGQEGPYWGRLYGVQAITYRVP